MENTCILVLRASHSTLCMTQDVSERLRVGCGRWGLIQGQVQLQVLVPCLEICSEHKELHEDPRTNESRGCCRWR